MRRWWQRRKWDVALWAGLLGIVCALEQPGEAFGIIPLIPQLVYDPAVQLAVGAVAGEVGTLLGISSANLAINTTELAQTIQILNVALAEYQRIDGGTRNGWLLAAQLPGLVTAVNRVGELSGWGPWLSGTPGNATGIWGTATIAIQPSPQVWAEEIPGQSKFLSRLASVEAIDDSGSRCLDQVAQQRGNWMLNQGGIQNMIGSLTNMSDGFNGTVGAINITNGTLEQGNEESRTQTALQTCLIEQTALNNKVLRDSMASVLNSQAAVLNELGPGFPASWAGDDTFTTPLP